MFADFPGQNGFASIALLNTKYCRNGFCLTIRPCHNKQVTKYTTHNAVIKFPLPSYLPHVINTTSKEKEWRKLCCAKILPSSLSVVLSLSLTLVHVPDVILGNDVRGPNSRTRARAISTIFLPILFLKCLPNTQIHFPVPLNLSTKPKRTNDCEKRLDQTQTRK